MPRPSKKKNESGQSAFSDPNDILRHRRKNVLIDYKYFMELPGTDNYDQAKRDHQGWSGEFLGIGNGRDDKWTRSIAVGGKELVDKVKSE